MRDGPCRVCGRKGHWGRECLDRASKHGNKVPERGAARVAAIVKEDPTDPWDEVEPIVAAGDGALRATLTTSGGREDGAVLQAYDAKRKRTRMERDAGTRRKPVLTDEWRRHVAENWTLPLQLLKGRSRREVYQQLLLAVRELFGRQRRAMRLVQLPQEESAGDEAGPEESDTCSDGSGESEASDEAAIEELMAQLSMDDVLSGEPEPVVARHASVREDLSKVDVNPSLDEKVQNEVWEALY